MRRAHVRIAVGLGILITGLHFSPAGANPMRGTIPLNFILCKTSDQKTPELSLAAARKRFLDLDSGGLSAYYHAASNGLVDFGTGTTLGGWYTLPYPASHYNQKDEEARTDCIAAATAAGYAFVSGAPTIVATSPDVGSNGSRGRAIFGVVARLDDQAHEFGHAIGWEHPFSQDTYFLGTASDPHPPGDYDDQDTVMAAMNDATSSVSPYGYAPPLPDAYEQDQLGWLPRSAVKTFGADGVHDANVTIVALGHPELPGISLLRIPFSADPYSYYTVEMVAKDGWNSGVDQPRILIKKAQPIFPHQGNPQKEIYTFLYRDPDPSGRGNGKIWSSLKIDNGAMHLAISQVSITAHHAVVHVHVESTVAPKDVFGPNTCASGYVWREADDYDYDCVSPDVHARTLAENAAPSAHHAGSSPACANGYVWREAYPADRICVTPQERAATRSDNAAAKDRLAEPRYAGAEF